MDADPRTAAERHRLEQQAVEAERARCNEESTRPAQPVAPARPGPTTPSDHRVTEIDAILQQYYNNRNAGRNTQMPLNKNWSQRIPYAIDWRRRIDMILQRPAKGADRVHVQQSGSTYKDDTGTYMMKELIRMEEAGAYMPDLFPIRAEYSDSIMGTAYADDLQD